MGIFKIIDKNLILRTVSLIVLIIFLSILLYSKTYFPLFVIACVVLMAYEWQAMIGPNATNSWQIFGLFYIALPSFAIISIHNQPTGIDQIIYLLIIVCSSDIFAYLTGRLLGGPKLAPYISPNKTWSGSLGGLIISSLIGFIFYDQFLLSFFIAIFAQLGDLFESWVKRRFNIKDSGKIIPGHGGILDRADSILFAVVIYPILKNFI